MLRRLSTSSLRPSRPWLAAEMLGEQSADVIVAGPRGTGDRRPASAPPPALPRRRIHVVGAGTMSYTRRREAGIDTSLRVDVARVLHRLGLFIAPHKWVVLGSWIVLVAGMVALIHTFGSNTSNNLNPPGTASQGASNLLESRLPPH